MGKNNRKLKQAPAQSGAPAAVAVQAAPDIRPGRRELLLFLCLAAGLILAVMWRPLTRGEIALNLIEGLEFEPWKSFPSFAARHEELLARPLVGQVQSIADAPSVFYPYVIFAAKELSRGAFPLWFPFADFGAPFLANQLSAVFDPFHIPFYLVHSPYVYNVDAFLRLLFAGFFAFLLARRVGLSPAGAGLAGAFALLAPSLGHLWSITSHARAIALLPALLWVTEVYVQERSKRALLDLAALVALSTFFGAPEISMDTFLQAGVYLLARLWQDGALRPWEKARAAAAYVGAAASAAVLTAVHLLPAAEYFRLSAQLVSRLKGGQRWDFWPTYTRPFTWADVLPLSLALGLGFGAWKAWDWLRRRGLDAPRAKVASALGTLFACLAASLCLFLLLGMDETFLKIFLPTPLPPFRYAEMVPLGGMFVEALALLALLDPELPPALRALFPGFFLAFAFAVRLFGFSHALTLVPGISLGYHAYHVFALCILCSFWTAWGFERLRRLAAAAPAARRRAAALFACVAALAPAAVLGTLYWENDLRLFLAGKLDVGFASPSYRQDDGAEALGYMGIGQQEKLFQVNPLIGWYRKELPIKEMVVGTLDGRMGHPYPLGGEGRKHFMFYVAGPAAPTIRFVLPGSSHELQLPRYEVVPLSRRHLKLSLALLAVAAAVVAAALASGPAGLVAWLVAACAAAELLFTSLVYVPSIPKEDVFPPNPVSELLAKDASRFRVHSSEPDAPFWPPASDSLFGLEDTRGCDQIGPLRAEAFRRLTDEYLRSPSALRRSAGQSLLDLVNVKYHFTSAAGELPPDRFDLLFAAPPFALRRPDRGPARFSSFEDAMTGRKHRLIDAILPPQPAEQSGGNFKLFRSRRAAPRALVFEDAVTVAAPELDAPVPVARKAAGVRAFIDGRPADFARTLVLHEDSSSWGPRGGKPAPPREARLVAYEPGRVEIDADAPRGGWLFLSDTYFPGWKATVDGRERPIVPAWIAFRAVGLEPGRHRVVFEYRPASFRLGLLFSALGWGLWLLLCARFAWTAGGGFFGEPGAWVVEGLVAADLLWWLAWTARHLLR